MASAIDATKPVAGSPTTQSVRDNFATAASEITALQTAPNQTITLSGDIAGSGTAAITTTLPTVNANVGTFQGMTVNAKGLVTAAANQSYVTGGPYLPTAGGTLTGALAVTPGLDTTTLVRIAGLTKAVRFGASSITASIEGVDQTGVGSYQPLTVGGTTVQFGGPGGVQVGTPTGGDKGGGTVNAVSVYASNVLLTSDASLKRDIEALPDCLPLVLAISPKSYRLELLPQQVRRIDGTEEAVNRPPRHGWGFIAQDVEAATAGLGFAGVEIGTDGLRSLSYNDLIAVLWQAVRELSAELRARDAPG